MLGKNYKKRDSDTGGESDLACERRRADTDIAGVEYTLEETDIFSWERIKIKSEEGARSIGRPRGNYDTLSIPRMDMLDEEEIEEAANEIAKELCLTLDRLSVIPERLLVVGLGNSELTPDAVGPRVASMINATMHIGRFDRNTFTRLDCSEIAVFTPGVMAKTGMESGESVVSICERVDPDAVLAIDALASRSPKRLGSTIQISDTGIFPGSGIGNHRYPLNEKTLGIPVIAIGVPTVINARLLLGEEGAILDKENEEFEDMFVSPREIDAVVEASSKIISMGINQAFGIF